MEIFTSPLYWVILLLAVVCTILAGLLGTYMARAIYYKEKYEKYYEKWYSVHKRANNAYWYLLGRWKQEQEMDDLCKFAFFELSCWYEDNKNV